MQPSCLQHEQHRRNAGCNAHHVNTQRNNSLRTRQAYQTRPGDDTTSKQLLKISEHPTSVRPCSIRGVSHTARICGKNTTTKQKMLYMVVRKKKRTKTSICDRWQNDQTYRESQVASGWLDAWVRYLYHIAQIDISHNATQEQRFRYHNLVYLRRFDEDRQAPQLGTRLGYCEAKHALVAVQNSRQELGIPFIIKCERQRSENQLDPQLHGYMSGKVRIGPSTSQKNANRRPHFLLLSGLQHPCGAHTRCLKTGNKDGINTVGRRMINGQVGASFRTRRYHGFKKTNPELLSTRNPRSDRHPEFFF